LALAYRIAGPPDDDTVSRDVDFESPGSLAAPQENREKNNDNDTNNNTLIR
jgi:hypothetical protein